MTDFTLISFLHLAMKTCLTAGLVVGVITLGERAFDFDVRRAINNIEKVADDGNVWPVTCLILGGSFAVAYFFG